MHNTDFVQYNDDVGRRVLYQPCQRVSDVEMHKDFIAEMQQKMRGAGIGLAANQLGKPLQIFMIEYAPDQPEATSRYRRDLPAVPFQVFVNPVIEACSETSVSFWHGCLSALDRDRGLVATYKWIEFSALNADGLQIRDRLDGFAAVIFQHEFRHLLGGLYIDHACEYKAAGEIKAFRLDIAGSEVPHLLSDYTIGKPIGA